MRCPAAQEGLGRHLAVGSPTQSVSPRCDFPWAGVAAPAAAGLPPALSPAGQIPSPKEKIMLPKKFNGSVLPGLGIPAGLWYHLPAFGETLLLELEQDSGWGPEAHILCWKSPTSSQRPMCSLRAPPGNHRPSPQRAKCFACLSGFMETLVVADDKMAAFHGTGLKRYLFTVMAATAKAFKH
uniref:Uncharacterized protein n=1 Tax=Molossus molossus TaxID=27622 RepID=A0A7J8HZZ8_MOLMO|nr:hypothetical protein HJG59_010858 [Molossus molossus]